MFAPELTSIAHRPAGVRNRYLPHSYLALPGPSWVLVGAKDCETRSGLYAGWYRMADTQLAHGTRGDWHMR